MAMIRSSIGQYLRYALLATAAVAVLPVLVVVVLALTARSETFMFVAALVGAALSLTAALVGSRWWNRRPESVDLSFGELMIWNFIRRRRAERELAEGAKVLGLDRKGLPLKRKPLTREQRLRVLQDLATALETKDPYTHGHSTRVERLVAQTAAALQLSESETRELCTAAALHDVGKIRIPSSILRKPSRLTIDEQLIVQEHSAIGAWMVAGVSNGKIASSVRHHHERWDGNGYPDGLSGDGIPLFARIIAVADSYDAMTSSRPYRASLDRRQAVRELRRESGSQFDPQIVDVFLNTARRRVPLPAVVGLGLLGRLLRRTSAWAARTGTAGVGPGVASVGAASVLVASMFSPPGAFTRPTRPGDGMLSSTPSVTVGEWDFNSQEAPGKQATDNKASQPNKRREREKTRAEKRNGRVTGGKNGPQVLGDVITRNKPSDDNNPPTRGGGNGPGPDDNNPPDGTNNPPGGNNNPPGGGGPPGPDDNNPPDDNKPPDPDPDPGPDDDDDDGDTGETGNGHANGHDHHEDKKPKHADKHDG